jgi:hypothetical protein
VTCRVAAAAPTATADEWTPETPETRPPPRGFVGLPYRRNRGRRGGGNVGPRSRGYTATQAERYRRAVSNNRRPAVVTEREALDAFMTFCQFFRDLGPGR